MGACLGSLRRMYGSKPREIAFVDGWTRGGVEECVWNRVWNRVWMYHEVLEAVLRMLAGGARAEAARRRRLNLLSAWRLCCLSGWGRHGARDMWGRTLRAIRGGEAVRPGGEQAAAAAER